MSEEEEEFSYSEVAELLSGGLRGWLLLRLLTDEMKEHVKVGLEKAYKHGYQTGYQQAVDNRSKERKIKWYINHQQKWLCEDCFEWIDPGWGHSCRKLPSSTRYSSWYEFRNKSPKGEITTMKKRI